MPKPTPFQLAKTDQANAAADTFIDQVLTDMVSQIEQGVRHANITARIGSGIIGLGLGDVERLVLVARALARLARLHHAVEQLADQWAQQAPNESVWDGNCSGMLADNAAELRKLVDDHG